MAISPREALELNAEESRECALLEREIDKNVKYEPPLSSDQTVRCCFPPISGAIQVALRQRFEAVGWDVAVSSTTITLRPKCEENSGEPPPS